MVRVKHRYLLFNIYYPAASTARTTSAGKPIPYIVQFASPSSPQLTPQKLASEIRKHISENFGDWGVGIASSLGIKYFSPSTSTGIIRIAREHYRVVWAALTYLCKIDGREVVFKVVKVSGTIKKAEMAAIQAAQRMIERARMSTGDVPIVEGEPTAQVVGLQMELDDEDGDEEGMVEQEDNLLDMEENV